MPGLKILNCMKLAWWKVWSSSDYVLELREGELLTLQKCILSLGLITSRWIVFRKLACMIRYQSAVCAIVTISGEWLQDSCTQDYVNTVTNLDF